jgi:hypothetical protein
MFPNSSDPNPFGSGGGPQLPGQPPTQPPDDPYGTGLVAPKSVDAKTKKLMQRTFIILLLAGIAVGAVLSVVVVIAFQKFGLLGVPTPAVQSSPAN